MLLAIVFHESVTGTGGRLVGLSTGLRVFVLLRARAARKTVAKKGARKGKE